jgi:CDP-glucose 4,6-dehydratase
MNDFLKFYNKKRIFITGHTGFVGSWVTKWLLLLGADVCGYSLSPPTKPSMYDSLSLQLQIKNVRGDVLDRELLKKTIEDYQPDIVFHFAAQPIVLEALENPSHTFNTNILGTVNLLDIVRKSGSARSVIVMTSDKTYKNNEWVYSYREIDPLGGLDPYSASKSCQDIVVNSFIDSYYRDSGISLSSVRAGNIIGGGDWAQYRIVPDLVRSITSEQIVTIRNPNSIRPWQFVLDPLNGILNLVSKMWNVPSLSGAWNFGPMEMKSIPVIELVRKFVSEWGKGAYKIESNISTKESHRLQLDISKATNELGWQQKYNFQKSLEKTVEWYKKYYFDKSKSSEVTTRQINEYMEI